MCPKGFLISRKMEAPQFAWPVSPVAVHFHFENVLLQICLKFPMFCLVTSDSLPSKAGKSLSSLLNVGNHENGCSKKKRQLPLT